MIPVIAILSLMFFTWLVAVYATYRDQELQETGKANLDRFDKAA